MTSAPTGEGTITTAARPLAPGGIVRMQHTLAVVILVAFALIAWHDRSATGLRGSDELEYRGLAESIEHGTYREIYEFNAPLGAKYPPAFPAWLVMVRKVAGDRLDAVRVGNLVLVTAMLAILYWSCVSVAGGWVALAVLFLTGCSRWVLESAGSMIAEALFLFLMAAALALALANRPHRSTVLAVSTLTFLTFLTRVAGITVVAAIGVWIWRTRSRRALVGYAIAAVIVVGGWFVYSTKAATDRTAKSYVRDLADAGVTAQPSKLPAVIRRSVQSAVTLATQTLPYNLALPTIEGTAIDNVAWLVLMYSFFAAGLVVLWRTWPPVSVHLVLYAGLMAAWPFPLDRHLVVAVPFILLAVMVGGLSLTSRLPARARWVVLGVPLALVIGGNVQRVVARHAIAGHCDRENPTGPGGCYNENERDFARAGTYLRAHSAPADLVISSKTASVYFLSGRRGVPIRLYLDGPPGTLADSMRANHVRFILATRFLANSAAALANVMVNSCHDLRVEAAFLPGALVVRPADPGETSPDACATTAQYKARVAETDQ